MGMFGSIVKQVLTEDKISDYIKKLIVNNTDEFYKQYLKTKVADLPENLQEHFKQSAEHSYNACVEHDLNLTQLFRLEFLNFFDLSHGKGPQKYIAGIARIAIEQLGMFYAEHDHSKISKLKAMALFINEHPDLVPEYDGNFNGIKYMQLEDKVYPILKEYNLKNRQNLSDFETKTDYEIVPIKNFQQSSEYGKYTSWCVTHEKQHFNSYTNNGQKFYFCLKEGFEDVPRVAGTNAPLDDYGLSMISVQVNTDGEPEHITTRWNHDYNGENNPGLKTPKQVQEVVGVNFYDTFKPWSDSELEELRENGDYEEDEEVKREQYDQQRWENAVYLWDDCSLMCSYDDNFEFNPNDEDYYVYDVNEDDYSPISYSEVDKEPVYVNEENKIAILKQNYTDSFMIIFETIDNSRRYERTKIEFIEKVDYYNIFEYHGKPIICYATENKFGYVCNDEIGEAAEKFDFGLDSSFMSNQLSYIFINNNISPFVDNGNIPIEVESFDGKHSLFMLHIGENDVTTIVRSDFPKNGEMFEYNERNGVVVGTISNYSLKGEASSNAKNSNGKILSIEENLDGLHYIVSVVSNDDNCYNLIEKGKNQKLIPFDFAKYTVYGDIGFFIPKRFNGGWKFDYDSYIFSLKEHKIVSKKHNDFSYSGGVLVAGDCPSDNVKEATFTFINKNKCEQEEGPFKKINSISNGISVVRDENNMCYVFDSNQFRFVKKAKNYDKIGYYLSGGEQERNGYVLFLQSLKNDEVYAYDTATMNLIDELPLKISGGCKPWTERNYLFITHIDEGKNIINLENFEKVFPEDVDTMDHRYGDMFLSATRGKFMYIFDLFHNKIYPSQYGIDTSQIQNIWFTPSGGRFFFFLNSNDGSKTFRIRYDINLSEDDGRILFCEVSPEDLRTQITNWDLIENAPNDIQIKTNAALFPQQKVQVMNNFNEMLDRMSKTKNGSIII